ncbi:hypothetical protein J6590_097557, partial [Homalodisca vitripennis]
TLERQRCAGCVSRLTGLSREAGNNLLKPLRTSKDEVEDTLGEEFRGEANKMEVMLLLLKLEFFIDFNPNDPV